MPTIRAEGQPPLFIVTSGRSGSTMLARMLRDHPELTVISDLFEPVGPMPYLDWARPLSGEEFWSLLAAPSHPERTRYWRERPTEELLFLPQRDEDVSLLRCYTLPFLSGDPADQLAEDLQEVVLGFEPAPAAALLCRTFAWLRDRDGGTRWVERTGGSLPHARALVDTFGATGRFVHLHRDPRDVASSMVSGSFFGLYLSLTEDPGLERWDWHRDVDPVAMARMVTEWEVAAAHAFTRVDTDRFHRVRYEDILDHPEEVLPKLLAFLLERPATAEDRAWAASQVSDVRRPTRHRDRQTPEEWRRLGEACAPALEVLCRG